MRYFITGASGFIGKQVLARLVARPDAEVHVLVRPASRARFEAGLVRFGDAASRIHVAEGDIEADGLVDASVRARLPESFDHVFHLAATYDMAMDAATAERANRLGTERVVAFVDSFSRPPVFHHVSSVAVAGPFVEGDFLESDLDRGQALDHPYYSSKFEAERFVQERCRAPFRIYRPGIVVGHSTTGAIDKIDGPYFFFGLVRRIVPRLPRWLRLPSVEGGKMPLVPVDYVADAIVAIAHQPHAVGPVFALVPSQAPSVGELVQRLVAVAGGPKVVRFASPFLARLANRLIRWTGALVPDRLAAFIARKTGIPVSVFGQLFSQTRYDDRNTRLALAETSIRAPEFAELIGPMWRGWEKYVGHESADSLAESPPVDGASISDRPPH